MTDLSSTIAPKSDQLNADDLISGPKTIRITKLSENKSTPDQPISIFFEGDNGKPYKPCKSMLRVLVHLWGADGSKLAGRAMTLYRDPTVKFGGFETGGIRISHMTHIDQPVTMALTVTRASRKPYTVQPLKDFAESPVLAAARAAADKGSDAFSAWWKAASNDDRAAANSIKADLASRREAADQKPPLASPRPSEGQDSSDDQASDPSGESETIGAPEAMERGRNDRRSGKVSIFDVPDDVKAAGQIDAWKHGWNDEDGAMKAESENSRKGA